MGLRRNTDGGLGPVEGRYEGFVKIRRISKNFGVELRVRRGKVFSQNRTVKVLISEVKPQKGFCFFGKSGSGEEYSTVQNRKISV